MRTPFRCAARLRYTRNLYFSELALYRPVPTFTTSRRRFTGFCISRRGRPRLLVDSCSHLLQNIGKLLSSALKLCRVLSLPACCLLVLTGALAHKPAVPRRNLPGSSGQVPQLAVHAKHQRAVARQRRRVTARHSARCTHDAAQRGPVQPRRWRSCVCVVGQPPQKGRRRQPSSSGPSSRGAYEP